jgi:hypothetical protein
LFYTIYKTTNKLNGKIYIGKHQTKDLNDNYIGSGKRLWNSIQKHGIENFEKEILFVFETEDEMNSKEKELVTEEFCLREDTYNLCPGGDGGWGYLNMTGKNRNEWHEKNSDTHMKKMTILSIQRIKELSSDPYFRQKQSENAKLARLKQMELGIEPFKGKKHTDETKRKIGEANSIRFTGEANPQFGTMWIYSLHEKKSKKIDKNQPIPQGWLKGRKIKFD